MSSPLAQSDPRLPLLLAEQDVLGILGGDAMEWLAEAFEPRSLRTGEQLYRAGDQGDFGYLVCRGKVRILRCVEGMTLSLGTFGPGTFFGAHVLPEHWLRSTDCRAADEVELYQLPREKFDELLLVHPHLLNYFDKTVEEAVLLETLGLAQLL